MKIKDIEFENNLLLAPMAGVTDVAFRSICIEMGASAAVTEMVSAKALYYDNDRTADLLITADNEKIKIVQIFGHEPEIMAKICASKYLEKFDIIDINMGCPAPKIVNNKEGSYLMTTPELAYEIISECVKATVKPITVKFRSGYDKNDVNAVDFAKMCERAGASAITIHGRTRDQMYSGKVDLDIIKKVKESVSIPVIASGDVVDLESYKRTIEYTHCDGVMIGRGAMGNPFVFAEILDKIVSTNKLEVIQKHIEILRQNYPECFVTGYIRKHLLWYLKGEKNSSEIKVKISTEPDLDNVIKIITEFFQKN